MSGATPVLMHPVGPHASEVSDPVDAGLPPTLDAVTALDADRQTLLDLIKAEAVFHGDFILSSGKQATYYVDMRKLTLTTVPLPRSVASCST